MNILLKYRFTFKKLSGFIFLAFLFILLYSNCYELQYFLKTPLYLWPLQAPFVKELVYDSLRAFNDILTPEEMEEDLTQLKRDLLMVHPATSYGFPEEINEAFVRAFESIRQPMTLSTFHGIVSRVMSKLHDSHTNANVWGNSLPLTVKIVDDRWYIISDNECDTGSELISIGFVPVREILETGLQVIPHENHYWLKSVLESYSVNEAFLSMIGATIINGRTVVVTKKDGVISNKYLRFVKRESSKQGTTFQYFLAKEDSYCYFPLRSAQYNKAYRMCLSEMFQTIRENKIENLIVDLRQNPGGNSNVILEFLKYIKVDTYSLGEMLVRLSESATSQRGYLGNRGLLKVSLSDIRNARYRQHKFSGTLFVLVDNATYSAATDFAVILSDNSLATIIGMPTGGKPTTYGDFLSFQLPNSRLPYTISHKFFVRPSKDKSDESTLHPDFEIMYSINDYVEGRDLEMEVALEIISQKRDI